MKKQGPVPQKFNSISDLHRVLGLAKPLHPLVSLIDNSKIHLRKEQLPVAFVFNFYKISYKERLQGRIRYGQNYYDFDEGSLVFTAPNQLIATTDDIEYYGRTLLVHPDFIRQHALGKTMSRFGFFSYDTHEALHLSDKEKGIVMGILANIEEELHSSIDDFSQEVTLAHIELLLHYSNRFYKRQFLTRKTVNHDLLSQLETLLHRYFEAELPLTQGLPTVHYLSSQLHVSPRYLSDMLRALTGQTTQQYVQDKVIEKAKEILTLSQFTVAEIAYQLGFEHPQSFHKLFKRKTQLSPLEYRESLN